MLIFLMYTITNEIYPFYFRCLLLVQKTDQNVGKIYFTVIHFNIYKVQNLWLITINIMHAYYPYY